jgi:hypothetical protein
MELSEETFNEIHRYLSGAGTQEERADFERRLETDEILAAEVRTQRRIRSGLKANEYKKLFKEIHAELQSEGALPINPQPGEKREISIWWPYMAAAASVLLAIGLIWYFNSTPKNTPIASETPPIEKPAIQDTSIRIEPAKTPDTTKTITPKEKPARPTAPNVIKSDFFADYFNANVTLESPFPKEKLGISPSAFRQWRSDTAHVYEGVRYLAQLESKLALQELAQVENSRFSQVKIQTEWYIALAYLQQNDLKNCKEQLKKVIANPENTYSRQAMELLGKIQ